MTQATSHTTNTPRRAHPAVVRAALRSHNRNDTESGRGAAQQRGTHRPTPCGYNRLIEVHDAANAIIATYRYDPFGRRLSKTANNQSSYYFYSAEGLIAEADSNGQIIQSYGYAPGSTFSTNPLWTKLTTAGTTTYYTYQNDHLGTPQKLLNQSGLTVWSATYDAFGKATVDPASTITNNLRFPGQYQDEETNLYYNWMRFYDPTTGRYVTSDPIGLLGGINTYTYVGGNPLSYTDPKGLMAEALPLIGGGIYALCRSNPQACAATAATILCTVTGTCSAAWVNDPEAYREWDAYKKAYRAPIPADPNDPCKELEVKIEREKQQMKDRANWDAKWDPGRHDNTVQQVLNRIQNLEKKLADCRKKQQCEKK